MGLAAEAAVVADHILRRFSRSASVKKDNCRTRGLQDYIGLLTRPAAVSKPAEGVRNPKLHPLGYEAEQVPLTNVTSALGLLSYSLGAALTSPSRAS
jgi:hypothetical protein